MTTNQSKAAKDLTLDEINEHGWRILEMIPIDSAKKMDSKSIFRICRTADIPIFATREVNRVLTILTRYGFLESERDNKTLIYYYWRSGKEVPNKFSPASGVSNVNHPIAISLQQAISSARQISFCNAPLQEIILEKSEMTPTKSRSGSWFPAIDSEGTHFFLNVHFLYFMFVLKIVKVENEQLLCSISIDSLKIVIVRYSICTDPQFVVYKGVIHTKKDRPQDTFMSDEIDVERVLLPDYNRANSPVENWFHFIMQLAQKAIVLPENFFQSGYKPLVGNVFVFVPDAFGSNFGKFWDQYGNCSDTFPLKTNDSLILVYGHLWQALPQFSSPALFLNALCLNAEDDKLDFDHYCRLYTISHSDESDSELRGSADFVEFMHRRIDSLVITKNSFFTPLQWMKLIDLLLSDMIYKVEENEIPIFYWKKF